MRITTLALAITSALSFTALAPGSAPPGTQDNSMHCMESMVTPGCPQTDKDHTQSKPPRNTQPQQPKPQDDMNNMPGMQHGMSGMQMNLSPNSQCPDTHATMTL